MNIFISWSGERSQILATELKKWLSYIFTQINPWMSAHDIKAGSKWHSELDTILENSNFGIICLTPENQKEPWLLYEAGALGKVPNISKVIPYRLGLSATDVEYPLAQFQGVNTDREGTLKLVQSINESCNILISEEILTTIFDKWWPDLDKNIKAIDFSKSVSSPKRTDRELIEEALELLRCQSEIINKSNEMIIDNKSRTRYSQLSNYDYRFIYLVLDTRPLFGSSGSSEHLYIHGNISVSDFLDTVYFQLNKDGGVSPYTYGKLWLIKDAMSGKIFDDIGIKYCESGGREHDDRSIASIGITDDSKLEVIPVIIKDEIREQGALLDAGKRRGATRQSYRRRK